MDNILGVVTANVDKSMALLGAPCLTGPIPRRTCAIAGLTSSCPGRWAVNLFPEIAEALTPCATLMAKEAQFAV
ncbi:hypothetical protein [Cupriavidus basilensis]|uniref:hypothetical protein n=1 Tax=Cupriavidus basilensis TaxID=68895 RepID=UPI0020A67EDC|nr:hypothetical protein [Cupriavidus basilensis]MCP3025150.1 hypothetical protein [Cupriavidus basilensis]